MKTKSPSIGVKRLLKLAESCETAASIGVTNVGDIGLQSLCARLNIGWSDAENFFTSNRPEVIARNIRAFVAARSDKAGER